MREKKKKSVSDDDDLRAKMLTWLLFHISEGGKRIRLYQGVDLMNTDSVVTEY